MIEVSAVAQEKSTFVLRVTFLDEDGNDTIPTAAAWTLTDKDGVVVNARRDIPISPLAAQVSIVLTGDDLALAGVAANKYKRLVSIAATYDSSLGTGLALTEQIAFYIQSSLVIS